MSCVNQTAIFITETVRVNHCASVVLSMRFSQRDDGRMTYQPAGAKRAYKTHMFIGVEDT